MKNLPNVDEGYKRKVSNQMIKSNAFTYQKRIDNNCLIPDLAQTFSYVENSVFNPVFIVR